MSPAANGRVSDGPGDFRAESPSKKLQGMPMPNNDGASGVPDEVLTRKIEAASERRQEVFTLSYLAQSKRAYTLKFRQGIADLVRIVDERTLEDVSRLDKLLDEVRMSFSTLRP